MQTGVSSYDGHLGDWASVYRTEVTIPACQPNTLYQLVCTTQDPPSLPPPLFFLAPSPPPSPSWPPYSQDCSCRGNDWHFIASLGYSDPGYCYCCNYGPNYNCPEVNGVGGYLDQVSCYNNRQSLCPLPSPPPPTTAALVVGDTAMEVTRDNWRVRCAWWDPNDVRLCRGPEIYVPLTAMMTTSVTATFPYNVWARVTARVSVLNVSVAAEYRSLWCWLATGSGDYVRGFHDATGHQAATVPPSLWRVSATPLYDPYDFEVVTTPYGTRTFEAQLRNNSNNMVVECDGFVNTPPRPPAPPLPPVPPRPFPPPGPPRTPFVQYHMQWLLRPRD